MVLVKDIYKIVKNGLLINYPLHCTALSGIIRIEAETKYFR